MSEEKEQLKIQLGETGGQKVHLPRSAKDGGPDFQQPIQVLDIVKAYMYFHWSQETIGFGECFVSLFDGKISMDAEGMGPEWTRRALYAAVDKLIADINWKQR